MELLERFIIFNLPIVNGCDDFIEKYNLKPNKRFYRRDNKKERNRMTVTVFNFIYFYSLVKSHENELRELMKCMCAKNVFNENSRRRLIKEMVIIPVTGKVYGSYSYPSCLTRMILSGLIDDEIMEGLVKRINELKEVEDSYQLIGGVYKIVNDK